jgi:membrane-associated protease RseP (regulator of RpoE activity)
VALMSILVAHEMGHYIACRYYRVDATLPFFIPFPFPIISLVGTLGAFIRIRGPIPHRRALFDIGIAGPLAGFVVALPVIWLSLREARVAPLVPAGGYYLGNPLLFQWTTQWFLGEIPQGSTIVIGSLGLAAWFGLFVTALNLMPVGQLDGGHVVYALFGHWAGLISRYAWWLCVGLIYFSPSWILWAVLIRILGRQHPPTMDDSAPVGRGRALVGAVGLAVFVVCFVPSPIAGSWEPLLELIDILPS